MDRLHSVITEHNILLFLLQFAIILASSKLLGLLFERFKQSTVTADIIVGLLLGPAFLGAIAPQLQQAIFPIDKIQMSMLETIAWMGNLFLLMETGLEVNFSRVWKQRGGALKVSISDLVVPILICFVPIWLLPDTLLVDPSRKFIFTLFISVIMTISALPVALRAMHDLNILKSDMGFLIVSSLTINDLIGWVLFTAIMGIFSHSAMDFAFIAKIVGLTLLFTIVSLTLFRRLVDRSLGLIDRKLGAETGFKTTFVIFVGLIFGAMTMEIGIHSLFGFFIAGIVVGESKYYTERDRHVITRMVYSIFVPIFFANIGLHLDLAASFDLKLVLLLLVIGMLARYLGAYIGSIWAGTDRWARVPISICHIAGGEMHIVVAMLAYSGGLINDRILIAIIVSAILSTMIFAPWLSVALSRMKKGMLNFVFASDSIYLDLEHHDKDALLAELGSHIAAKLKLQAGMVTHEIMNRETAMSTAVGKGIAFPHARLKGIKHPLLIVARNAFDLDWDSPDGKPVRVIFLIITPENNEKAHLTLLQIISKVIATPGSLDILRNASGKDEIVALLKGEIIRCDHCLIPT